MTGTPPPRPGKAIDGVKAILYVLGGGVALWLVVASFGWVVNGDPEQPVDGTPRQPTITISDDPGAGASHPQTGGPTVTVNGLTFTLPAKK